MADVKLVDGHWHCVACGKLDSRCECGEHEVARLRDDLEQATTRAEAAEADLRDLRTAARWVPVLTPPARDPSFTSHSVDVLLWDGREVQIGILQFGDAEHDIEPRWSTTTGYDVKATHWAPLPSGPEASRG